MAGALFAPPSLASTGTTTSLTEALRRIAGHTGAEIVSLEPELDRTPVKSLPLEGSTARMLDRLLRGTGYRAVRLSAETFRIERSRTADRRVTNPVPRAERRPADSPGEIIVTASKFPVPLMRYPGSVVRMRVNPQSPAMHGDDMDNVMQRLPVLQGTELGEGRNKIFIRGLVDSSFNGATQPTASIYLGDAPLGIGSPSPSLKLYDVASVEVLEGPQGTLYGSGSLGGIVRIEPNAVDFERVSGSLAAGIRATVGGAPGWDTAGIVNLPLVRSRAGRRFVAYHEQQGGYIHNVAAGQNSNSVAVDGGRAAFSAHIGQSVKVDAGILHQETSGRDGQYANGGRNAPLRRRARIAEPYANELTLGYLVAEQKWDSGIRLSSVTSIGFRSSFDQFDATPLSLPQPLAYQLGRDSTSFAQELRLAHQKEDGISWVLGTAYQRARDAQTRSFGRLDEPAELDEVTNITYNLSLFGQGSIALTRALDLTAGLRWTQARTDSDASRDRRPLIRGVTARRLDPTIALSWRAAPRMLVYTRFQTGYRNGGMAVERGVGRVANFEPDSVAMAEIGVRRLRQGTTGLSASMALSYTRWDDIQADLIVRRGSPYTANIGDARVVGLEGSADWTPMPGLEIGGSFFYTDTHLRGALTAESARRDRRLPDTPPFSATVHADYGWEGRQGWRYRTGALARYAGRSTLGPGALLDMSQGDYVVVDLQGGIRHGAIDMSLSVENLFDTRGNRFAFGNPTTAFLRDQSVPVRPATIRLGMGVSW